MKDTVKKSIKIVFSDRTVATLLIVNVVVAIVVSVKLISLEKRSLAIFILWLTLGILAILAILAYSIIKIASIG